MPDLRDQLEAALGTTYVLERELGGGGMSRVFLAVERALSRRVVIKVLPPEMAASVSIDRFRREIMLAARLQNPHIVPLLSAGEANGVPYLTMPFVDGESLRVRLARGGELPVAEGLRVLREVASALDYAHKEGIVHRDIKPDNVLLSHGSAMVTDFGVAKAISSSTNAQHDSVTSTGIALGTPTYMSPEQAAASPAVDARADIYAFGVVAYELFAGHPPFAGRSSQALLAAHITEQPEPIQKLRTSLPPALATLIMRCLEKRPADRPQSAAEIIGALDTITVSSGGSTPAVRTASVGRWLEGGRARVRVVALTVVLVGATIVLSYRRYEVGAASRATISSVAVLPFTVGADSASQYFADGLTEELIGVLASVPSVRVAPRSAVFALQTKDVSDLTAVGRRLGASLIVEGTVRRTADRIKVSAELIDARANAVLASRSVERAANDVFTLEDNVAHELVSALAARLGVSTGGAIIRRGTTNEDAYDSFLKGQYFANRFEEQDFHHAISLYDEAIRLDSMFARPWAGIASAWTQLADQWVKPADAYPKAEFAARKALALDSSLAAAHATLGMVLALYERDLVQGLQQLRQSVALDSKCADGVEGLALVFAAHGMRDSAVYYSRRLISLDSLSATNLTNASVAMQIAGDVDDAVSTVMRRDSLGGFEQDAPLDAFIRYRETGQLAKADSVFGSFCRPPVADVCRKADPLILLTRHDTVGARRALGADVARTRASGHYYNPMFLVPIEIAFGDTAVAYQQLEQALNDRTASIINIVGPGYEALRGEPRFKRIVHLAGLDVAIAPH